MPKLHINGIPVEVERGATVLEAAHFLGIPIPTLCHDHGLTPYGACRLCLVEVGPAPRSKLQSACTVLAEDGLVVQTHSARVERARRMLIELYVAACPQSKTLQDLASRYGVRRVRLKAEFEDCIQCGKCVRLCAQQMMAGAIGFAYRGHRRKVMSPFRPKSDVCRHCGARKFALAYISRDDLAALTPRAAEISGIPLVTDADHEEVEQVLRAA